MKFRSFITTSQWSVNLICTLLLLTASACQPISGMVTRSVQSETTIALTPTITLTPRTAVFKPQPIIIQTYQRKSSCPGMSSLPRATGMNGASADVDKRYFIAPQGHNSEDGGTQTKPWATISYALKHAEDGAIVWVLPGLYEGQVALTGSFPRGIVVRSCIPYQAQLRHNAEQVIICFTCQGITLEGFDIAHSGPGAAVYVIQIQDLLGKAGSGASHVSRVTLRNNVIHDSYNNDLIKINNGARQILIEGNMFYNQQGLDSHIDINGVLDVIVQDNVFFNDFAGSGRENANDTGSFVVIKDSNGGADDTLGASNIVVRRNVFFNWEGEPSGNAFIAIGEDPVTYYQAYDVLVENNLLLGNSPNIMRAAIQMRGSRDITFRHNTVSGNLPSLAYAFRLSRHPKNPPNKHIAFYNNIWSDPTGSMGSEDLDDGWDTDFSDTNFGHTASFTLTNNLYWNGGTPINVDVQEMVNYTDDAQPIMANPFLTQMIEKTPPRWLPDQGHFANGATQIQDVFAAIVRQYGISSMDNAILSSSDPNHSPYEDILGTPRNRANPSLGAVEQTSNSE